MRICLIALCVLGRAVSGVSAVATHDVPIATSTFDDQKFKIARSVTSRIPPNHNVASNLRGSSATAAFAAGIDRVLKEDDNNGEEEEENGQGQVEEECDKDCEKARKEDEKARKEDEKAKEKAEKEAAKAAEEAAKAAEKAAEDAAKAAKEAAKNAAKTAEKENEDEPNAETIEVNTTPNEEKPDETTNAVLVEDEATLLAPSDNADGQDSATDEEALAAAAAAAAAAEEEEPEVAATDGPFVVAVDPTSVSKEDLGDDNKAVLPPPTEDNTIFDITTEDEGTTSQNNKPTVVDVSINDGDGFPGPVRTDTDSGLTFSSSSSSSANDGGLQPVGKALLSVALAGVFVAFVAVFLLRRQRRSSSSDAAANALEITPYSPSKDDSYFVDRDESYGDTPDAEKRIVTVNTADSSPAPTPEKISSAHDHEDANEDEEESSQSASLTCFSENALSMLPCQLDISPCSKPTMPEASTDDSTSAAPLPPDLRAVAAPSTRPSKAEGEESEENFSRNNTARELMRKYKMDDVSVNKYLCPSPLIFLMDSPTNVAALSSNSTSYFLSHLDIQQRRLSSFEVQSDRSKEESVTATVASRVQRRNEQPKALVIFFITIVFN